MVRSLVFSLGDRESKSDFEIIMFLTKIIELFCSSIILLNVCRICSVVTEKSNV